MDELSDPIKHTRQVLIDLDIENAMNVESVRIHVLGSFCIMSQIFIGSMGFTINLDDQL